MSYPTIGDLVPVEQKPVRIGQFGTLAYRHGEMKTDDMIRIVGSDRDLVGYTGQRFTTSVADLVRNPSHIHCQLECTRGAQYKLNDCRLQPVPEVDVYDTLEHAVLGILVPVATIVDGY